jgi:hypothetical protein
MILLCNGCSHTSGAELEYPQQGTCYEKAWGKHLANHLNCDYENLAISGASNNRIIRTTYKWLFEYVRSGKDPKDLFVVIMWPGVHRTEVHFSKKFEFNYDDRWVPIVVGNDTMYKENFPKSLYNYYKSWTVFTDQTMAVTDYFNSILNLQNMFFRYKIKYLFINAVMIPSIESDKYNCYKIHVNKDRFIGLDNPDEAYTIHAGASGQKISPYSVESGFNSHYDEGAMKWYAQHLFDFIKDKDLL